MRPGRLGRHIHVGFPKVEGKVATYVGYLNKVTHDLTDAEVEKVARNHYRGTGAEVQDIVNEAVLYTFRDGRKDAGLVHVNDIMNAMLWRRVGEAEGTAELESSRWNTAVHEAGHTIVQHHLRQPREKIWFVSIEKRGNTGGMMFPVPTDEDGMETHTEGIEDIAVSLGSGVAEILVLGEMGVGHNGDRPNAEHWAKYLVRNGYGYKWKKFKGRLRYSAENSDAEFNAAVEKVLRKAMKAAWKVLETRTDQIEAVAKLLAEEHTVLGDDIHDLLDRMEAAR
jgi:ATP-dependent Zn protease